MNVWNPDKKFYAFLWLIVFSAFVLRIVCAFPAILSEPDANGVPAALMRPDSAGYYLPALALLKNGSCSVSPDDPAPATQRPPGYSFLLALWIGLTGYAAGAAWITGCLAGALTCYPVGLLGRSLMGRRVGLAGSVFFALNLTALANSPLMLADTLLGLICAWQFYFLLRYSKSRSVMDFAIASLFAGTACLVKPVNLPVILFLLPVLAVFFCGRDWKKIVSAVGITAAVFVLILFPWMLRNRICGVGFGIDSNSAELYFHNGSAILVSVTGEDSQVLLDRMMEQTRALFRENPDLYPDLISQNRYKTERYIELIRKYPFDTLKSHIKPLHMLLPDLPSFLENNGLTRTGQGTLAVLRRDGIFAAAGHYLNGRYSLILFSIPFLAASLLCYLFSLQMVLIWLKHWKWRLLLLFGIAGYYLLIPGPVTMPRYQLPALPFLCAMAGCGLLLSTRLLKRSRFRDAKK